MNTTIAMPVTTTSLTKGNLLLVDDDADILKLLSIRLKASGYQVMTATSGEQALSMAAAERPNVDEVGIQLRTAVPADTELLDVRLRGGVLLIDVSKGLLELSGEVLVAAVAQIVFTGAEVESVRSVSISVDGQPQLWPAGNGDLQSDPLTIYDYPGLVPSAQPEYPAIPTPSQPGS